MRTNKFTYKICKVGKKVYIQIWEKTEKHGSSYFVRSCGTADKLQETLVKYEELVNRTNELAENLTKISEGKKLEKD